jgi:hypothetical protein
MVDGARRTCWSPRCSSAWTSFPRQAFFGAVTAGTHGSEAARLALGQEIEDAVVTFLPPQIVLHPRGRSRAQQLIVQPHGVITSPSCSVLVEAKRIRHSSFQPEQLARESTSSQSSVGAAASRHTA